MPKTKIVCTVGPATRAPEMLERMIRHGMNVVRLNFSHGTHEEYREIIADVRRLSRELNKPVAILQDLAGPKVRVGRVAAGSVRLEEGAYFTLTVREVPGDEREISVTHEGLPADVCAGDPILLSDGVLRLEVVDKTETDVRCQVINGGTLSSQKGINLPTRRLSVPCLTDKDRTDLRFGVGEGVDYVALSFVRTPADVRECKRLLKSLHSDAPLIAKIEKHEALEAIDDIIDTADGIMVARGDLGVETPLESVPLVQKMIIDKTNFAGKPVITATQMLLSMVNSRVPTRAEVTDVANAILDGTDAVMMSDETAIGKFPVDALDTMVRIARDAETGFPYGLWTQRFDTGSHMELKQAIGHAACHLAEDIGAVSIVSFTQLGGMPQEIAKHRPRCRILAPTPLEKTYRRLALVWAVMPVVIESMETTDILVDRATAVARQFGSVKPGDTLVITAGVPVGVPGTTNTITTSDIPA